jgi:hypothetical protein
MGIQLPVDIIFKDSGISGSKGSSNKKDRARARADKRSTKQGGGLLKGMGKLVGILGSIATFAGIIITLLKPLLDLFNIIIAVVQATILKSLKPLFTNLATVLKKLSDVFAVGDDISEAPDMGEGLQDAAADTTDWLRDELPNMFSPLAQFPSTIWEKYIKTPWVAFQNSISTIWEVYLKPMFVTLGENIASAWTIFKEGMSSLVSKLKEWVDRINPFGNKKKDKDVTGPTLSEIFRKFDDIGKKPTHSIFGTPLPKALGGIIPSDGLYKMHAGENVSRGNTVNNNNKNATINVNVSGGSAMNARSLAREINTELQTFGRW